MNKTTATPAAATPAAATPVAATPVAATPVATTSAAATVATPATLPDGYLRDGYFATTEKGAKYLRPEYVGTYAQQIAAALSPMKPSDFASLLREMKRNKKRSLPFGARQTAILQMRPKAISLVRRKRAPKILSDFINANIAAVNNDDDWMAFFAHCEAIQGFLYDNEVNTQEGTEEADGGQATV